MAGTLVISTLSDGTNSTSATNSIRGGAKVWVNFNGNTAAIRASYNVTSVTRNSTGNYTITFTNSLGSASYCAVLGGAYTINATQERNFLATTENYGAGASLQICTTDPTNGAATDMECVNVACFI